MNDEIIWWSGYKWLTRERWGSIHPYKSYNWYDPSAVEVTDKNQLKLHVHYNPREFTLPADEYFPERTIVSEWGIGLLTCETEFSHGLFTVEAMMPKGKGMWPAFWMYDPNNKCIPEIDIFEGYSGQGDYKNDCLHPYRVESCLHLPRNMGFKKFTAKSPWIWNFNSNPSDGFHTYQITWTKDKMEFRIDAKTVRKITNRKVMDYCSGRKMILLVNTHIDGKYQTDFTVDPDHPFTIKYFDYLPFNV